MKIGKIRVRVESRGGTRYFYCRPVANAYTQFNSIIGRAQVVYVEKNEISNNFEIDHEYEFYGIFLTSPSIDQFNDSICDATVSPISEYAFNVLRGSIESRNDFEHAFAVNNN